ncbi:hypothetical protein AURDEDRAFT_185073 [Auricularia subglabra TFB-10046 SS5]|nr:hypothetical protein AURDEDRAFT_185073 [Auricularia subglabra TFB-10046 SS5]
MSTHQTLNMADILGHVFVYFDLDELLPLRLVAHLWDACVRESAAFSDNVSYDSEELTDEAVEFFLLRLHARQHPVRVSVETRDPNPDLFERLLAPIGRQLHRILELQLELYPEHVPSVRDAFCHPAPLLRKFTLNIDLDPEDDDDDDVPDVFELPGTLFAGVAPRLTDVSLSELILPLAPPAAFATVRSLEFYVRAAEDIARTINPVFTTLPLLSDLIIAVPRAIWTPATATEQMAAGARRLRAVEVSAQQEYLVRWLQAVARDFIGSFTIIDDVDTPSLELFAGLLAERPTDDLALQLAATRARVRSLNIRGGAAWVRTLDNCPSHHPAWLAEWLAVPVHAHRVVHLEIASAVWPGLCESVRVLPNLTRLRLDLGQRAIAMGEVELEGVLGCPSLREVTLLVALDEDEIPDDALRGFARNALDHGHSIPRVDIERKAP